MLDIKGALVNAHHKAAPLATAACRKAGTAADKAYAKVRPLACFPFEHPTAGTLVYGFLAGIFASLGAQLVVTPVLTPTPPIPTATLLQSGALLFLSSAFLVRIAFELDGYKEEWMNAGRPAARTANRWQILEKIGLDHSRRGSPRRQVNRVWGLWIILADSLLSACYAALLLWTH